MSSVQRAYAQRNVNNSSVTTVVPTFVDTLPNESFPLTGGLDPPSINLQDVKVYSLDFPNVQHGSTFVVDMSSKDSAGDLLDVSGIFSINDTSANIITFAIDMSNVAVLYPGLEFTVFFKNPPRDRLSQFQDLPFLTIGLLAMDGNPIPYIFSPPLPSFYSPNIYHSLTFKSDGANFNVVSSGPAGWLGIGAFLLLLSASGILNN